MLKRFLSLLLLFLAPQLARADWTFSVTNAPVAIVSTQNGPFSVTVRENTASPTAAFTIYNQAGPPGPSDPGVVLPAGAAYQFTRSTPWLVGQTVGWIKAAASGPFTFAAITQNTSTGNQPPQIGVVPEGDCLGNTSGTWSGKSCGGGGGGGAWSDLTAPTGDLALNMATHATTMTNAGLFTYGGHFASSGCNTPGSVHFTGADGACAQDNANLFHDATTHFTGFGTNAPIAFITSRASSTTGPLVFTGVGLNDAQKSGTYTGETDSDFGIFISIVGAPDEFKYFSDVLENSSSIPITAICPATQPLALGMDICFASDVGHTLNDEWDFTATAISAAEFQNAAGTAVVTVTNSGLFSVAGAISLNDGNSNAFVGQGAGNYLNAIGINNSAVGKNALRLLTTGSHNTALGYLALSGLKTESNNTALGSAALAGNAVGADNTAIGSSAMLIGTGVGNSVVGSSALASMTTGSDNAAIGNQAGPSLTTGDANVFLGLQAGQSITTGDSNTMLGNFTQGAAAITNSTAIGAGAIVTTDNTIQLGNNNITKVNTSGAVSVNPAGMLLTGSNGSLTLLGLGDGADGDLKLDLNAANVATVTSSTGVATFALSGIALSTTEVLQGLAIIGSGTAPSVGTCGTIGTGSKNTAGFITSDTTGSCVSVLTFSYTAPTGWGCGISNGTTANLIRQTDSSTTTATFTGVTVTNDTLRYICNAY